ncbi:hypothetical protein NL676_030035 [Syzygium grande]|nr:hypothetical protein NL676_030035 [Syzygium grande]
MSGTCSSFAEYSETKAKAAAAAAAAAAVEEECPPPLRRRGGLLLARRNCRRKSLRKSTGPACLLRLKFYGIELDEEVLRVGTRMVGRTKVEEVKNRFREFQMAELKMAAERAALAVERAALKLEVTKLLVDGYLAATK